MDDDWTDISVYTAVCCSIVGETRVKLRTGWISLNFAHFCTSISSHFAWYQILSNLGAKPIPCAIRCYINSKKCCFSPVYTYAI